MLKYADVEIQALEMFNIARLLSDKINMLERSQNVGQCFKSRHFDHGLYAVRALVPYPIAERAKAATLHSWSSKQII